jgi:hypothetical protein
LPSIRKKKQNQKVMNARLKKIILAGFFVLGFAFLCASCKAPRAGCPAYGGEAKRFQVERIGYR